MGMKSVARSIGMKRTARTVDASGWDPGDPPAVDIDREHFALAEVGDEQLRSAAVEAGVVEPARVARQGHCPDPPDRQSPVAPAACRRASGKEE